MQIQIQTQTAQILWSKDIPNEEPRSVLTKIQSMPKKHFCEMRAMLVLRLFFQLKSMLEFQKNDCDLVASQKQWNPFDVFRSKTQQFHDFRKIDSKYALCVVGSRPRFEIDLKIN